MVGGFSFAKFYQRRAKRILPPLFAVLAFSYGLASLLLSPVEIRHFSQSAIATILSLSNVRFWLQSSYFAPAAELNPLLMTWSLGVEEQFYLAAPLLLMLLLTRLRRFAFFIVLLLSAISFAVSIVGVWKNPAATFYLLPTRAWELGAGLTIAIYEASRTRPSKLPPTWRLAASLSGLSLLMYSIYFFNTTTTFPGALAALPVCGTALMIVSKGSFINRHLLSAKPMVFVGLVSYSWYLWHWPLLSFARLTSDRPLTPKAGLAAIVASFGLAVLSYRFIEQPFRRSAMPAGRLLKRYGLVSLVMLVPPCVLLASGGWPKRFPALARIEQRAIGGTDRCLAPYGEDSPDLGEQCIPDGSSHPAVALVGDSHAGALAEALREVVQRNGMTLDEITKSSCAPVLGVMEVMPNHPGHDRECAVYNRRVIDFVQKTQAIRVVVLAAFWGNPITSKTGGPRFGLAGQPYHELSASRSLGNLQLGLNEIIHRMRAAGKRVVVVADSPRFGFDPLQYSKTSLIPLRNFLAKGLNSHEQSSVGHDGLAPPVGGDIDMRSLLDKENAVDSNVNIFDLRKGLCDVRFSNCLYTRSASLFYRDPHHLSKAGAEYALDGFEALLK